MRVVITLACTECKQKNYSTTKNIKKDKNGKEPGPMEVAKFCRYCKKKSLHREI
jgi:large subunit ribosomal protein L33